MYASDRITFNFCVSKLQKILFHRKKMIEKLFYLQPVKDKERQAAKNERAKQIDKE